MREPAPVEMQAVCAQLVQELDERIRNDAVLGAAWVRDSREILDRITQAAGFYRQLSCNRSPRDIVSDEVSHSIHYLIGVMMLCMIKAPIIL